jgi:hypothetical protein
MALGHVTGSMGVAKKPFSYRGQATLVAFLRVIRP